MAAESQSPVVGLAVVVDGSVKVESISGVSQIVKPNSPIYLNDKIDTSSNGSVSIALNDTDAIQIDLGRMSQMIIDEDVAGGPLPDLSDVAVDAGLVAGLFLDLETITSVETFDTLSTESEVNEVEETSVENAIPGLEDSSSNMAANDSNDEGVGSIDEDLDMTNLIPPPEDAS